MAKENLTLVQKIKNNNFGTDVLDTILSAPKKYRKELENYTFKQNPKITGNIRIRDQLKGLLKQLKIKDSKEKLHKNYFSIVVRRLETVGFLLSDEAFKKVDKSALIELKEAIEHNILKGYNRLLKYV